MRASKSTPTGIATGIATGPATGIDRAVRLPALVLGLTLVAGAQTTDTSAGPNTAGTPRQEQQQQQQRQGGGADPSDDAFKMGSPPALPPGVSEEQIWPAATAEGWKQPCLIKWQRTFADALKVARAENRPLLVAVNMDGEIASEHFAGVRYRDPVTAALMSRYVCVIASVYRHTPRDYDETGARVECPRFGTVTCSEHIENERELYAKYFDGKRISPRHIVLDLEEKETLDVYFSWDTETVITTFKKGVEGWPEPSPRPEKDLTARVQSSDVSDREFIERSFKTGDRETKRQLLQTLLQARVVDQVELLRAAIFGFDPELAKLARRALAQCDTEPALDLMAEALQVPLEASERELLLAAVTRLAQTSPRAKTLAALHSGLPRGSQTIDTRSLAAEYGASSIRNADLDAREGAVAARPKEPAALLEFAEALLARAEQASTARYATLLVEDARTNALAAEKLGASGARLDAVLAVAAAELGDRETAAKRAVAAVEGGLLRLRANEGELGASEINLTERARGRILRLFADARQRAIRAAFKAGTEWPPEWLADVNAAYTALAAGDQIDESALLEQHDFLRWLGATARANAVLDEALERFPNSAELHARLRGRLLYEGGPAGLEKGYEDRLAREATLAARPDATADAPATGDSQLTWFAGYASLVAAEHLRRRNQFDAALAAYGRAARHYQQNIARFPDGRDTALHFVALGAAGEARVLLEQGDLARATERLLAAFETRPDSAATQDGLGLSPIQTAKMLFAKLEESGDPARAARVQAALDALDPRLLEPPPSERFGSGGRGRRQGGQTGGPGGGR
ncbi:MAG: hypothetical protein L6Q99_01640 [Planctomycetes bacterium]|nr:hypothetical protein [Planctomycetota bacterium]